MFIAGLTGGAGCGKSTFRKWFCESSGASHLDADRIVRELMDSDAAIQAAIRSQISPDAYDSGGRPNRAWLRELIFRNPASRRALEGILHPAVRREWQRAARQARGERRSLLVEIPLLFEKNLETEFDCSILVAASPLTQEQRLQERGIDPETARKMLAAQLSNDEKIPRASHVVWNDGTIEFLQAQAEFLSQQLNRIHGN